MHISSGLVKYQKCGIAVPLLRALTRPRSNRIDALQKQVNCIEDHSHGNNAKAEVRQIKQELAELLEEDANDDKASVNRSSFI